MDNIGNKKLDNLAKAELKKEQRGKLNRRQFFKVGAAVGATSAVFGMSTLSGNNGKLLAEVAKASIIKRMDDFPVIITDKCKQMDQKNTIFCRRLWDQELIRKLESIDKIPGKEYMRKEKGWTPLDDALERASWALNSRFATGSPSGQPHSQAYEWEGRLGTEKIEFKDPEDASKKVKKAARFLKANLVGIAKYDPLWNYSPLLKIRFGRRDSLEGQPRFDLIPPEFPFKPKSVVVIALEMDYKGIALSPSSIESAATGLGYSDMSAVGYSVATFIRQLGYKSFACGNDVSLSIPYAVAAGLGELGRNGMLITPEFGPRVRLVKVFTELEIKPDKPKTFGIWEFCKSCMRCAESCPSNAISFDEPTLKGTTISNNPGVLKWYIDPEKCYQFWRENGSDCANCITSCPFNKPSMWHHQLSASLTTLPIAPLHFLMAKIDKLFGFGNTYDKKANAAFWN